MCRGEYITQADFPPELRIVPEKSILDPANLEHGYEEKLNTFEKEMITKAIHDQNGNQSAADVDRISADIPKLDIQLQTFQNLSQNESYQATPVVPYQVLEEKQLYALLFVLENTQQSATRA